MFNVLKKSKLFTLIELIVVIVILGILAAIVIPNISSFQEEAEHTAIISNSRNLQTSVDMFALKNNGVVPTKEIPTLGNPQVVEVYALQPDYLRDLPKTKNAKYWLDHNGTVWASMIDAPTEVKYDEAGSKLTWKTVEGAELYKVYKSEDSTLGSSLNKAKGLIELDSFTPLESDLQEVSLPKLEKGSYLVSSIDRFDLESAPVKVGSNYKGYISPTKDVDMSNLPTETPTETPVEITNHKPVAIIDMTPSSNLFNNTIIQWSFLNSIDEDKDEVVEAEWKLNDGDVVSQPPSTINRIGENTIALRVKDSKGDWSEWTYKTFNVEEAIEQKGLRFNGTGQYAAIPNNTNLNFASTQNFTIETWIKAESIQKHTVNPDNDVIEKWDGSGSYPFVVRYYRSNGSISLARYNGSQSSAVTSLTSINDNKWHHVAFVKEGTSLKVYIDGKLDNTSIDTITGNFANTSPIYLARRGGPVPNYFTGSLEDLRIWNVAHSQSDVVNNMAKRLQGNEQGLAGYWKLNEGSGTVLYDSSINKNNGISYSSWQ